VAEIIRRHAMDDFCALMTAEGMEAAGCYVFSITYVSDAHPMRRWIVWGRFHPTEATIEEIDKSIARRVFPTSEGD
jgi:hypothetical protein